MELAATWDKLTGSGTARILFSQALRGSIAAAVPFLVLRAMGHPGGALFTTIAALFLSVADAGGPYRERLTVMLIVTTVVPLTLFAGMHVRETWYVATVLMFLIAMAGGMTRLLGPAGIPIGLMGGLGFVIGLYVPGGLVESLQYMGYFVAGAAWTILLALVVWRVRPYRRLRYQAGEAYSQIAATFRLLQEGVARPGADYETRLSEQQRVSRDTLAEFRETLGTTAGQGQTPPAFIPDLIVLLNTASAIEAAAVSLTGMLGPEGPEGVPEVMRGRIADTIAAMGRAAEGIAAALLAGVRYDSGEVTERMEALDAAAHDASQSASVTESVAFLDTCFRHLQIVERATSRLAGRFPTHLTMLPPLHGPVFPNFSLHLLRANLTFRSLLFRHGVRMGLAAALGTALYLIFHIPHGIWLPLTTLLILQPHFGATLPRALHRVGGTLVGAGVASLVVYLSGGWAPGVDTAILVSVFFTVLFIRRTYWIAVVFITLLIILLLDLLTHHPWESIIERVYNTLGGAAIALVAGYLLWPSPERRRLPEQFAEAVEAGRQYLADAFAGLSGTARPAGETDKVRGQAELAIANVEAALGRMLAEPRHMRQRAREAMAMLTYLQRLGRHTTRLTVYVESRPLKLETAEALHHCLDATLAAVAVTLRDGATATIEDSGPACRDLEAESRRESEALSGSASAIAFQVSEIVDDINNLAEACAAYLRAAKA